MNVLVTGAAGFIGSSLVDALLSRGDGVVGLDNFNGQYDPRRKRRHLAAALAHPRFELVEADLLDASRLRGVMARQRPDAVVHLAALVSNRRSLQEDGNGSYLRVNAGGTAALLAACDRAGLRSFVLVSTGNVYDSGAPAPFREGATPERPRTPYAQSKLAAEALALAAAGRGLPATVVRLFTTYGPRQRPDMVQSRFAAAMLRGEPLTLIGDGSDLRDYVHVRDGCRALLACVDRAPAGEVINIGSGQGTTLDSLLTLLSRITGRNPVVERRPAAAADTRLLLADIAKAGRLLAWKPQIGLAAGLEEQVAWMKQEDRSSAAATGECHGNG